MPALEIVRERYADTFSRVCPGCWNAWNDRRRWVDETVKVGAEMRQVVCHHSRYNQGHEASHNDVIMLTVRRHKCGGLMYSPGLPGCGGGFRFVRAEDA